MSRVRLTRIEGYCEMRFFHCDATVKLLDLVLLELKIFVRETFTIFLEIVP